MRYRAILFDVDGVLLRHHEDYPDVYRESVGEAFREFGVEPTTDELNAFVGSATVDGMQRVCDRHDVDIESFWQRRERYVSERQQRMMEAGERVLYDDCDVLAELAEASLLGLVSNNQDETIRYMVEYFELGEHLETVYGREPTVTGFHRRKPDTYYLERAVADVGTDDVLYVGDSDGDVVAAHEAGVDSAFVRRPHRVDYATSQPPTYEIEGLDDLLEITKSAP